ncbi:putative Beta-lactamase hydrolase-family protein [uncultured Paludibacter sp.]|nr:putative Beta-lactamase hydrolase-family protein [uncultured Paludibacter sp.]
MTENYFQYSDKLSSGAQPTEEEIAELKKAGFEVVFNISTPTAKNALINEAAVTEKLGMYYVHFPVDCSDLQPIHYNTFAGIMNGLADKKVFVHCGANIKSSNLIHMYDVLAKGKDELLSLETLFKIQIPEDKWFDYFKKMGMRGVSKKAA